MDMRVAALVFVGLLAGCVKAPPYQVSPEMRSKAIAMSDAEAQQNLARLLKPTQQADGFCVASQGSFAGKDSNVVVEGNRLRFRAPYIVSSHVGNTKSSSFTQGKYTYITETVTYYNNYAFREFTVDLTRVDNIHLLDGAQAVPICRKEALRGKVVAIQAPGYMVLQINIAEEDAPLLMTTLIHINPNARLLAGIGF